MDRLPHLLLALPLTLFALTLGCGEPSQEELLQAATETFEEARLEVEEASAALEKHEEELAMAQSARDQAAQRLRAGERALAEAKVQVSVHATDDLLFRTVQQALLEDEILVDFAVSAQVDDGVVTLSGDVPNQATRAHATQVAERVPRHTGVCHSVMVQTEIMADLLTHDVVLFVFIVEASIWRTIAVEGI